MDIMSLVHDDDHEADPRVIQVVKDALKLHYRQYGEELSDKDIGVLSLYIGAALVLKESAL
jgi:transcriptional antiterminator